MKRIRLTLLWVLTSLLVVPATAQRRHHRSHHGEYKPTVYLISVEEIDTTMLDCEARQEAALMNRLATAAAIQDHEDTWRPGQHQAEKPNFIFASKNNRFSLALGGAIELRTSYDFEGIVDNRDFLPSAIPMHPDYNTSQQLMMDATASNLFLKAITNTRHGRVVVFVEGDFRGGAPGSYTPRVRSAFVNFAGITAGRDVTTFCDLEAVAPTIDYAGPNAYNLRYATLLRYEFSLWRDIFKMGMAAEMPKVSAVYGDNFAPLHQRMPDFPVYMQFAWGRERMSHIRLSGVFRNMYAFNLQSGKRTSLFGWGAQVSGHICIARPLELFFNGVYGQGVSPYIHDIEGAGLDFQPNPAKPESLQAIPAFGWQAAARLNLIRGVLSLSGGYSMVQVNHRNGYLLPDEYRKGQYIFGNIFYHLSPRMSLAVEYLYGTRNNMDGAHNHANRASMLIKYHF